jgi:hypothetical protein
MTTSNDPPSAVPSTLQQLIVADLKRAQRLIIKHQSELDPQWRIASPNGDYYLSTRLQADPASRTLLFDAVALFMAWKSATAFTLAAETNTPHALSCTLVTPNLVLAVLAPITSPHIPTTLSHFGPPTWLDPNLVDPALVALLPRAPRPLTPKALSGLEPWFGTTGLFPALHIATGRLGL